MPTITVFSAKDFRVWLKKYHVKEQKVAVVLYKRHTGKSAPTHRELIEEAICFGWIDTTIKKLDEDTFMRKFSRRNAGSTWSTNTLSYAKALIKAKRMTLEGLRFYKEGLQKPTHDHGIPKNPSMPPLVLQTLKQDPKALTQFRAIAPSTRRALYRWFLKAKGLETQKRRAQKILVIARSAGKKYISPSDAINS